MEGSWFVPTNIRCLRQLQNLFGLRHLILHYPTINALKILIFMEFAGFGAVADFVGLDTLPGRYHVGLVESAGAVSVVCSI